jgi:hypothetical protein
LDLNSGVIGSEHKPITCTLQRGASLNSRRKSPDFVGLRISGARRSERIRLNK